MSPDRARPALSGYTLVGIGSLNLATLLAGLGLGWFIDGRLGSFPACALVGLAVGIAAGLTLSWLQIRKYLTDGGSSEQ